MNFNKKTFFFLIFCLSLFHPCSRAFSTTIETTPKISHIIEPDPNEIFSLKESKFLQKQQETKLKPDLEFDPKISAISIYQVIDQAEIQKIKQIEQAQKAEILAKAESNFKKPSHLSTKRWKTILKSVSKASQVNDLPEELILALIKKESSFRFNAISSSGAVGLTQLKPSTAKYECGLSYRQLTNIDLNIHCGVSYLSKLINIFNGRLDLAVTSYNAGPGAVKRAIKRANSKELKKVVAFLSRESQEFAPKIFMYSDLISKSKQ